MVDRPPVHSRAFQRRVGHAQLRQPACHLLQRPPERLEPPHGQRALTRPLTGQPDRHPDHLLVHIDPGHLRMDDLHGQPPCFPRYWIKARRPRSPRQDQDPVTRARSSNPGYPPGRLQRQSSKQARNAKVERRQRAAQPQVSPIRGRHESGMKSSMNGAHNYASITHSSFSPTVTTRPTSPTPADGRTPAASSQPSLTSSAPHLGATEPVTSAAPLP